MLLMTAYLVKKKACMAHVSSHDTKNHGDDGLLYSGHRLC